MPTLAERKAKLYANYQSKGLSTEEFKQAQKLRRDKKQLEKENKNRGAIPKDRKSIDSNEKEDHSQSRRSKSSFYQNYSQSDYSKYSKIDENKNRHIDSGVRENLIAHIYHMGWKGHENYSFEQLIDVYELLQNYFKLMEYCDSNYVPTKTLTKYSIENLRKINKELETSIKKSNNKQRKNFKAYRYDENSLITNPKDIERERIRRQIKKFVNGNIHQIKNSDLLPLKHRIEKIKTFKSEFKVSDIDSANLFILNHELESYGLKTEITTEKARKSINCHKSREILKEKYPEIGLPDNCKELLKLYDKKMKPKDFPDMKISEEKSKEWERKLLEKGDGRSGEQLYLNTESDIF